jgi:hypothetical protein
LYKYYTIHYSAKEVGSNIEVKWQTKEIKWL